MGRALIVNHKKLSKQGLTIKTAMLYTQFMVMIDLEKAEQFRSDLRRLKEAGVSVEHEMAPRLGIHRVQLYRYIQPSEKDVPRSRPTLVVVERCRPELDALLLEHGLE